MWLKSHLDDHDLVVIDGRGVVAYSSGHIKNALPLGLDDVISISKNGANLAIEGEAAENLFGKLGIDESKKVVVYGEYLDPCAARIAWTLLSFNTFPNLHLISFVSPMLICIPVGFSILSKAQLSADFIFALTWSWLTNGLGSPAIFTVMFPLA